MREREARVPVADALGAPFEFGPAGEYSSRFPSPVWGGTGEMTGGGGFGWAAGEFTDDVWSGFMEGAIRSGIRAAHLIDPALPAPAPAVH